MSSYWAATYGSALLLSATEFEQFRDKYNRIHAEHPLPDDDDCLLMECECISSDGQSPTFCIDVISADTCDGGLFIPFMRPDTRCNREIIRSENKLVQERIMHTWRVQENTYIIWSNRSTSCFSPDCYKSYEELEQEYKDKVKDYVPADFDWKAHIGEVSYAQYA